MEDDPVNVALTPDEAIVLFELVHRWEDADRINNSLETGEQAALWALSAALEKTLVAPFQNDYADQLQIARARLAAATGT